MHLPDHSHFSAALQQPRPQSASTPTLFAAWRAAWHSAPVDAQMDVVCLAVMTPGMLTVFALLWWILPA